MSIFLSFFSIYEFGRIWAVEHQLPSQSIPHHIGITFQHSKEGPMPTLNDAMQAELIEVETSLDTFPLAEAASFCETDF
jgi:hypothetical protein